MAIISWMSAMLFAMVVSYGIAYAVVRIFEKVKEEENGIQR